MSTSPERGRTPSVGVSAGLAGAAVGGAGLLLGVPLLLVPTAATLVWVAVVLVERRRRASAAEVRRERVVAAVEAMLGELGAGQPPGRALDCAVDAWPELAPAAAAHRLGSDVPGQVRRVADLPGAGALAQVAAAWELCGASGVSLGDALEQVLATVRAEHDVLLAVAGELAAARATVRLVAGLPLLVLGMGSGIGADPWAFLTGTAPGQLCLWAGVTLASAGVMWLERIADRAQGHTR